MWWMSFENNRGPLLYLVKFCAMLQSHGWIQTGVTVRKCSICVKIAIILSFVTSKFDRWPWRQYKFYSASRFVHHFRAIKNLKLSYSPEPPNLDQNLCFFVSRDLEIWQMSLKNNRAHFLRYFKFCASFQCHWWIQTGDSVRKRPIWVNIDDFCSRVTLKYDRWPWPSSFVHHFIIIFEFWLELWSGNG